MNNHSPPINTVKQVLVSSSYTALTRREYSLRCSVFSHKSQNEFIERLQLTAHTYIDMYYIDLHTYAGACGRTCTHTQTHTHTHTKEKQIKQAVLRYAQPSGLPRGAEGMLGVGGRGRGELTDT